MKIITFSAIKGGVGKTTLTYNFGSWLASKGNKVLFIDLDHQSNLTQTLDIHASQNTVGNIFLGQDDVTIHAISDNISLIAGDMRLDEIETSIENKANKNMLLYLWLEDNYEAKGLGEFDYIILDTHPDFSVATRNAMIISHAVISPLTPSEHGYNAKFNLEQRIEELRDEAVDYRTRTSYLTAKLFFVGNMVEHNTKSSHELLAVLENDDNVLAIVPKREVLNRTMLDKTPVSELMNNHESYIKNHKFLDDIDDIFTTMAKSL